MNQLTRLAHSGPCPLRAVVILCLLHGGAMIAATARAAEQPNIIFILADDLGYGDLGCYGQKNFATPHLDRMAAEGMRFTQHYAGSTVCAPSRACLLTGQHTGHVYQRGNGNIAFRPDPQDVSIGRMLKQAGYHTAMIGKSGLSCNTQNGAHPNEKGFDHFFGYVGHGAAHRYYPPSLWRNGKKVFYPDNHGKEGKDYSTDLFLADAKKYLNEHRDGPFFLHLALQAPHADLNVPAKWRDPFIGKFEEKPHTKDNHYRAETHSKATFAGMVTHLDDAVGQILDQLRELGIEENTLVFFSSDNGPMSEGGWDRDHFDSNGPLRGGKRDMYEGGIRVPLIAWQPGTIKPGSTSDHVSAFWDFVPTACEAAGVAPPTDVDGISYLPTLRGEGKQQEHDYLYWEFYERGGKQAVRQGDWKAVRLDVEKDPNGPIELYNLSEDLGETRNVAAEHPEIVARFEQLMRDAHVDNDRYQIAEE
jgi:arylsulfatase A